MGNAGSETESWIGPDGNPQSQSFRAAASVVHRLVTGITSGIFILIGFSLMIFAVLLIGVTHFSLFENIVAQKFFVFQILNAVGSTIIGVAILDLSKFVLEEEFLRNRELRTVREVRESLTKFMTIIVIAISLEALVMVFKIAGQQDFSEIVYPVLLMLTAVLALVGLAVFQWLTRQTEHSLPDGKESTASKAPAEPVGN